MYNQYVVTELANEFAEAQSEVAMGSRLMVNRMIDAPHIDDNLSQPTYSSVLTLSTSHARTSLTLAPLRLIVVSFHSSTKSHTGSLHSTR